MRWEQIVGENIRRLRIERGLTQESLALSAQVDLRYLGSIERGKGNPSVALLGRLAFVLSIHPEQFWTDQTTTSNAK
jgi:transcriptional regulator with XRE-family HTH domain